MKVFLITYQLVPTRNNPGLVTEVQNSPYWWHFLDFTWLIATNETAEDVYSRIAGHLLHTDRELIVQIRRGSAYAGWLPKEAWDWIEARIGPPQGNPFVMG
jgi:hypothetical protein